MAKATMRMRFTPALRIIRGAALGGLFGGEFADEMAVKATDKCNFSRASSEPGVSRVAR